MSWGRDSIKREMARVAGEIRSKEKWTRFASHEDPTLRRRGMAAVKRTQELDEKYAKLEIAYKRKSKREDSFPLF